MPSSKSQTEATLAELGIGIISERLPLLMNMYLGTELVTTNEERTRAAALMGFKIGSERVYIPLLFLNGRVKGTEIMYLADSDTFTSASKQWIDFLGSKNPGVVGEGDESARTLQLPMPAQLQVYRNVPGFGAKGAALFEGAAEDFWSKVAAYDSELVNLPCRQEFNFPNILRSLGKQAYVNFMEQIAEEPELLEKLAHYYDMKDLTPDSFFEYEPDVNSSLASLINSDDDLPGEVKTALLKVLDEHPDYEKVAEDLFPEKMPGTDPEINSKDLVDVAADKVKQEVQALWANAPANGKDLVDVAADKVKQEAQALGANVPTNGSTEFIGPNQPIGPTQPAADGSIGDYLSSAWGKVKDGWNNLGTAGQIGVGALGVGAPLAYYLWKKNQEEEEEYNRRPKMAFVTIDDLMQKSASIDELSMEDREHCMTHGFVFMDKRAAEEKTLVCKESYRSRFREPEANGFYELINRGGNLEKVFIAVNPFLMEHQQISYPDSIIVDVESGAYYLPGGLDEVLIRQKMDAEEEDQQFKAISGMASVSSVSPNKVYMFISPDGKHTSAPFTVKNKEVKDGATTLTVRTPWDVSWRAVNPENRVDSGCSTGLEEGTVRIVDREDGNDNMVRIGEIVFIPKSWKALELSFHCADDSSSDGKSDAELKAERLKIEQVLARIKPGNSATITSAILSRDMFEMALTKSGSFAVISVRGKNTESLNKVATFRCLTEGLGMSMEDATDCWDEMQASGRSVRHCKQAEELISKTLRENVGRAPGAPMTPEFGALAAHDAAVPPGKSLMANIAGIVGAPALGTKGYDQTQINKLYDSGIKFIPTPKQLTANTAMRAIERSRLADAAHKSMNIRVIPPVAQPVKPLASR